MSGLGRGILVSVVVFLFAVSSWTVVLGQEIKIGVIGPMKFVQGKGHWNGATMAAEEINAKGGVQVGDKKMKVKLIQADSNEFLSVTDATNAMERLITKDKVDFIVGGFRTEAVLAMQDIAMEHRKIFIGCGAAHNELCPDDPLQFNRSCQSGLHPFGNRRSRNETIPKHTQNKGRYRRRESYVG
jgi:branched-chain amino acid transport system substrate-binding protein